MGDGASIPSRQWRPATDDADCVDDAVWSLVRADPDASAHRLFSRSNARPALAFVSIVAGIALLGPTPILIAINVALTAFFLASIAFRVALVLAAKPEEAHFDTAAAGDMPDADLPAVTILLPLFREAASLPGLARAIAALDYPPDKLDILLILEREDVETASAAKALALDRSWRIIVVPPSAPQTKPKACNYALHFARGALTVIYDAEDEPEPDQLRKAAARFAAGDQRLACLQAHLNFYNVHENWLTRLFAIEYALWFDTFLPGLRRLRLPIPLGGTSNIFRTEILRRVGAWDPFNVTEDADLGLRLARRGYRVEVLDSTTYEEANCRLGNWLRQRSRWMKGYMQTFFVHARNVKELAVAAGWRSLLTTHLFVGGTVFAALVNPLLLAATALSAASGVSAGAVWPQPLLALNIFALVFGNLLFVALAAIAPLKRGLKGLAPSALLAPLYWQLTSIAAYRGLWQLIRRPHFWEKTDHMISPAAKRRAGPSPVNPLQTPSGRVT